MERALVHACRPLLSAWMTPGHNTRCDFTLLLFLTGHIFSNTSCMVPGSKDINCKKVKCTKVSVKYLVVILQRSRSRKQRWREFGLKRAVPVATLDARSQLYRVDLSYSLVYCVTQ